MQPFIRANDATEYVAVIAADDQAAANVELVDLQMCCKKAKESHIDKSEQHLLRLEGRRRVLREARPAAPAQLSFLSSSTSPTTTGCQAARVLPRRAVHLWAQGADRG